MFFTFKEDAGGVNGKRIESATNLGVNFFTDEE